MINYIFGTVMSMNHGLNEITVSGPIVIFRAKGAYNMAGIKEYEQEFVKLVTPLMGKPWGIVNLYPGFETGGPEVIERIVSQYRWCIKNGCQYIGFHRTNVLHDYFAKQTTDCLDLKGVGIFESEKDVMSWMSSKLT